MGDTIVIDLSGIVEHITGILDDGLESRSDGNIYMNTDCRDLAKEILVYLVENKLIDKKGVFNENDSN